MRRLLALLILAFVTFALGFVFGRNIEYFLQALQMEKLAETFVSALATLVAGFGGVYAAFYLSEEKEKEKEKCRKISALLKAQMACVWYMQVISEIKKSIIDPARDKNDPWFAMKAMPLNSNDDIKIEAGELNFIVEDGKPNFLLELLLEQEGVRRYIRHVNQRSEILMSVVYPRMEAAGINRGDKVEKNFLKSVAGDIVIYELEELSNAIFEMTQPTIDGLRLMNEKLLQEIKNIDKNKKGVAVS